MVLSSAKIKAVVLPVVEPAIQEVALAEVPET
jgi:hypothetical protein